MQCTSCGRDRPRAGKCPHCGATPTTVSQNNGSYSSLRGWKDQAQGSDPEASQPPRGRPSRPNPNDSRASSNLRSNTPSRPRQDQGGDEWGPPSQSYGRRDDPSQSYARRDDPSQSYARRDDPNQSISRRRGEYGNVDEPYGMDDHALMVPPLGGGALAFPGDERALPALPSEEEERALGIRRPAFIPATEERTGQRAGRWRVLSGVASIMILCVGLCGVAGFFARSNILPTIQSTLGLNTPPGLTPEVAKIPVVYQTPATLATPAPNAQTPISNIKSSKSASDVNSQLVTGPDAALFIPGDTVYITFKVDGAKANDNVSIKWYINNLDITDSLKKTSADCCSQSITDTKPIDVIFRLINVPSAGLGKAAVYYNNTLAYTVLFDVVTPAALVTPTVTPPAKTAVPAPTATVKH